MAKSRSKIKSDIRLSLLSANGMLDGAEVTKIL